MALTPGFLRSERVLEYFGVSEANWREAEKNKNANVNSRDQNNSPTDFLVSESSRYIGRAMVALAADPKVKKKGGRVFSSWVLAREYGFTALTVPSPTGATMPERSTVTTKSAMSAFIPTEFPAL